MIAVLPDANAQPQHILYRVDGDKRVAALHGQRRRGAEQRLARVEKARIALSVLGQQQGHVQLAPFEHVQQPGQRQLAVTDIRYLHALGDPLEIGRGDTAAGGRTLGFGVRWQVEITDPQGLGQGLGRGRGKEQGAETEEQRGQRHSGRGHGASSLMAGCG
ncbi:hypothetical protein D3C78_1293640 [compost metagenome]